jgi:hypothetical protein
MVYRQPVYPGRLGRPPDFATASPCGLYGADLVALQPNMNINLHIVAPVSKRAKVLKEIRRPVFSLLEGRALSDICSYLSYEKVEDLLESKHLAHLSDSVIEDYAEKADSIATDL